MHDDPEERLKCLIKTLAEIITDDRKAAKKVKEIERIVNQYAAMTK